jgi:glucose/mannose-6-phosphate isomerase
MLDNSQEITKRDPENVLGIIATEPEQALWDANFVNFTDRDWRPKNIVLVGMGGSSLAGLIAKQWFNRDFNLNVPFEIVRDYSLPNYVNPDTLVIAFSVSGNTEETISALRDAQARHAYLVAVAAGGKLLDIALAENVPHIKIAKVAQPRYGVIMHLRALSRIFESFHLISGAYNEISQTHDLVAKNAKKILPIVPTADNLAKRLAMQFYDNYPIVYASSQFAPLAYKWKISFNENSKNVAWWNEFSELNHNEMIGWTTTSRSEKFVLLELLSDLDHPKIHKRFTITNNLLRGNWPALTKIQLSGKSYIAQTLTGLILADFATIYLAILKRVDPATVMMVEKLKREL